MALRPPQHHALSNNRLWC